MDEYASYFKHIDPVSQYKRWTTEQISNRNSHVLRYNVSSERVKAAFVASDPVDWGRDIQVFVVLHAEFLVEMPHSYLAFMDIIQSFSFSSVANYEFY